MCNNSDDCKCISEILSIINILQQNAECGDSCLETCDRGFLGCNANSFVCNTRPVMLYTCCGNGVAWSMPISRSDTETTSNVFRVEKVDGCCCTFRVLATNPDTTSLYPYVSTDSLFTMDANCLCCIRCLNDTYVECL